MRLIVQKFGGSSVANNERIFNVAGIITDTYKAGNDVVVVLSAQGDTTDDLIAKAEATYEPLKTSDPNLYEKLKLRTLKESVCVRALILVNYGSYYNIEAPRYTEAKTQFQKDAEKVGISTWNEKTGLTTWLNSLP